MRFRTVIEQSGPTATGIVVPDEVVEALGGGRKPAVTVTVNGHTYRSSVATMGGRFMVGLSAENRAASGAKGGDEVDVDLELDTAKREIDVPDDLATALASDAMAQATWDGMSYSNRRYWTYQLDQAKTPETRQRRVEKALATLREGRIR